MEIVWWKCRTAAAIWEARGCGGSRAEAAGILVIEVFKVIQRAKENGASSPRGNKTTTKAIAAWSELSGEFDGFDIQSDSEAWWWCCTPKSQPQYPVDCCLLLWFSLGSPMESISVAMRRIKAYKPGPLLGSITEQLLHSCLILWHCAPTVKAFQHMLWYLCQGANGSKWSQGGKKWSLPNIFSFYTCSFHLSALRAAKCLQKTWIIFLIQY